MNNNGHKCVLMTDANHTNRKLYLKAVAYYKNLIDKGEEEHLPLKKQR